MRDQRQQQTAQPGDLRRIVFICNVPRYRREINNMIIVKRKLLRGLAATTIASTLGSAAALASERNVDPNTLSPNAREFALHGPLGDRGPNGRPAEPGCVWSRLQIPTSQGLRWVAHEDCNPEFGHG
jgi:hypothetical protein